jgi:hypothetical protein
MFNGDRKKDDVLDQLGAEPLEGSGFEAEIPDRIHSNGQPESQTYLDPNSSEKPGHGDEH